MAFTPQEQEQINRLKAQGKSTDEIAAYVGGLRLGSPSSIQQAEMRQAQTVAPTQPITTQPLEGETMEDITQTLSNVTRRWAGVEGAFDFAKQRGQAVQQSAVREEGETALQNAGQTFGQATRSGLQIGGEFTGAAFDTLGELFIGAGKVFLPQSGEDAVSQAFQQAIEPIASSPKIQQMVSDYEWLKQNNPNKAADVRAALGGINALSELVGFGIARPAAGEVAAATTRTARQLTRQGERQAVEAVIPTAVAETTPKVAQTGEAIVSRIQNNIVNTADTITRMAADERARLTRIKNSDPVVADAIRANVPDPIINQYVTADTNTKPVYRELVEAYKSGEAETAVPQIYSRIAGEQYGTVTNKLDELGRQYQEAFDTLPKGQVDMRPALLNVQEQLAAIGAQFDQAGRLVDAGRSFTPDEAEWVKKLYDTLYRYGDDVNYQDLRTGDEVLSRINREAYAKDVTPPRINGENLSTVMRDAIRNELDQVLPGYRELNDEYRRTIQFKDALDKTIFDTGRQLEGIEINAAEATETNLRRLFSNAKSKTQYREVTRLLDEFARNEGYTGSRLEDVARFHIEIQNIYPDQIPKASFGGGIRGAIGSFITGKTDLRLTQEALEKMVGANTQTGAVGTSAKVALGALAAYYSVDEEGNLTALPAAVALTTSPKGRKAVIKALDEFIETQSDTLARLEAEGLVKSAQYKKVQKTVKNAVKERDKQIEAG